jgi:hypothetical protein
VDLDVSVVVASGLSFGSVNCICILAGTSMAGLSSAVHITVTLDSAAPSGLTGSLIRVTETGCVTAWIKFKQLIASEYHAMFYLNMSVCKV